MGQESRCPNCGSNGWSTKKDFECPQCGFHKVDAVTLPEINPTFCEGCGCTLSNPCTQHDASKQRPVR